MKVLLACNLRHVQGQGAFQSEQHRGINCYLLGALCRIRSLGSTVYDHEVAPV